MSLIQIQPTEITKTVHSIQVSVPFIVLNSQCFVKVLCHDENDKLIHTYDFMLEKPDYDIWQKDEDLIDYVCQKYNFSRIDITQ